MKLHKDILNISFRHKYQISKIFKNILGLCNIDHFSLDLVNPEGEMIFFSGTPSHGYEICKRGYGQYDGIISPENYENYEFYWWENTYHKKFANKIIEIREGMLGLRNGFMLVRKWNNFYLIYSFATKSRDLQFQSMIVNNINKLLEMGDFCYMEMREAYSDYSGNYDPPIIKQFYPFEGGKPPSRYTNDYLLSKKGSTVEIPGKERIEYEKDQKIILIDFKRKIRLPNE